MAILLCLVPTASAVAAKSPEKTASGIFFADPNIYTGEILPETLQLHWEIAPTVTPTASGRQVWLSADPIGEEGGMSLYAYVLGDPINGWDPYGLEFWAWNGTAGAWAENVTTFSAGYSDSATFGLTDLARDVLYRNHGGDSVNKCSDSYEWGENAQIGTDVATLGASGGLKLALKAKGKSVARAEANRAIRGLSRTQHHINTVIGHPGGIGSYFPTGGLPASIHSSSWNLRQVT